MSLYAKGLSLSDISLYYNGGYFLAEEDTVLVQVDGLELDVEYSDSVLDSSDINELILKCHVVGKYPLSAMIKYYSLDNLAEWYPDDQYAQVNNAACWVEFPVRRTAGKSVREVVSYYETEVSLDGAYSNTSILLGAILYSEGMPSVPKAIRMLIQGGYTSVVLSKNVCLSAGNKVMMRGREIGRMSRGKVSLANLCHVYKEELEELGFETV